MIPANELTKPTSNNAVLYMALDLGGSRWAVAFSDGRSATKARVRMLDAGDVEQLMREIGAAKTKLGLPATAPTRNCYEAGRDGFWLHRVLTACGVENVVIDASSLEVARHARRAKTDRIDVRKMLSALVRHHDGAPKVFSVVRVPSEQEEDERRLSRERDRLHSERTALRSRSRAMLALQGVTVERLPSSAAQIARLCRRDGTAIPEHARREIERMLERLQLIETHLELVGKEQHQLVRASPKAQALLKLRGVGPIGACVLLLEVFGWRRFDNAKQVGAALGLCPTPYRSDGTVREQGVSKRGNPRVRSLMVELAWCWLRLQPHSALSRWFNERFAKGGGRSRRVGIVAVARRLLIDLWRYLEHGVIPEGAIVCNAA